MRQWPFDQRADKILAMSPTTHGSELSVPMSATSAQIVLF
jgi:hypothetical protein